MEWLISFWVISPFPPSPGLPDPTRQPALVETWLPGRCGWWVLNCSKSAEGKCWCFRESAIWPWSEDARKIQEGNQERREERHCWGSGEQSAASGRRQANGDEGEAGTAERGLGVGPQLPEAAPGLSCLSRMFGRIWTLEANLCKGAGA